MRKRIVEMSAQVARMRTVLEPFALPPVPEDEVHPPAGGAHDGGATNGHGAQPQPASVMPARMSLRELHAREESGPPHPAAN
jgi:hypothetical protein